MTSHKGSASQLLNGPHPERFNVSISQVRRRIMPGFTRRRMTQVISKSSYPSNVLNDVSNAENVYPQTKGSANLNEEKGKVNLDTCSSSPPAARAPYIRHLYKLVPNPKGQDCKIESPLNDHTSKTIRLHGRKENTILQGDVEYQFRTSTMQVKLFFGASQVKQSPLKYKAPSQGFQAARVLQDTMGCVRLKNYMLTRGVCENTSMCHGPMQVLPAGRNYLCWRGSGWFPRI